MLLKTDIMIHLLQLVLLKDLDLKRGAFASSVAHDSHNIIAVGTNDEDIVNAINEIVQNERRTCCHLCREN